MPYSRQDIADIIIGLTEADVFVPVSKRVFVDSAIAALQEFAKTLPVESEPDDTITCRCGSAECEYRQGNGL